MAANRTQIETIELTDGTTIKVTFTQVGRFDFKGYDADVHPGRRCKSATKATAKGMTPIYFGANSTSGNIMCQLGEDGEDFNSGYTKPAAAFGYMLKRHWDESSEKFAATVSASKAAAKAKAAKAKAAATQAKKVVADHAAKVAKKAGTKKVDLTKGFEAAAAKRGKKAVEEAPVAKRSKKEAAPVKGRKLVVKF